MKRKILSLLLALLGWHAYGQNSVATIKNNTGYTAYVVLSGTDDTYFGARSYVRSNTITVPPNSWLGTDVNTTTTFWGWAITTPGTYPSYVSPQTLVWKDARVILSGSSCANVTGGASNPGCGILGFSNPFYICPSAEHVTWTVSTCNDGDDITVTIDP